MAQIWFSVFSEAGLHLSNLLTALGLAIRDTLILEGYLKILPILNPLRSLMLPTHFIIASFYLQGKHFRNAYQYACCDSADDEEGLILCGCVIWLMIYMGGALLCHNITICFWFLWNISSTVFPFVVLVLLLAYTWYYLDGRPLRYMQLGLSIFIRISYHLIGYMILASKIVTPAIIIFLYRIWMGLFSRNENHYYEILRYERLSEKRSIRLLQLSRPFPFGPVKCELSIHRIDSRPSYEAISYTWGDPSQSRSVIINGCKLEVTSNAFDILEDRATFLKTRKIWIDSICINQVDKEEKSVQIPLMREIYSRASRVLVWLGSQPDSRIAMGFISNLNRRLRFGGLQGPELKTILEIGSKSPNWPALFSLLNHQYWTRSWIIQEIAVAEPVHIFYGGSILTWEYFASTIEMLTTQDVGSLFIPSTPVTAPRQRLRIPIRGTDCIRLISRIRSTVQRESCMELVELLQFTSRSDVTEAKDRIFALLGIADPAAQNSLSRMYNKELQEIYVLATRHLLSQQEPLRVLHHAGIGHHRITTGLPSWAVDWHSASPRNFWRSPERVPYRASGASVLQFSPHPTIPIIEIRGQCIDEIERCGRVMGDQAIDKQADMLETTESLLAQLDAQLDAISLANSTAAAYHNGQCRDEALWRTLMGDHGDETRPAPAPYKKAYEAWRRICIGLRSPLLDDKISDQIYREIYPGISYENLPAKILADHVAARTFYFGIAQGLLRRKFAVSKQEGYFMLVPELAQPGDLICIFGGAQTPFLVRGVGEHAMGSRRYDRYELVGECYVHGIMDGEAVSDKNSETFILV